MGRQRSNTHTTARRRATGLGAVALGFALTLGAWYAGLGRAGWRTPGPTFALPSLNAEVFFMQVPQLVRAGPGRLVVVRIAGPAHFVPHTFASAGLAGPQPIERWAEVLQAPLLFNAGQFDENLQHLGWLKGRDRWLVRARKPAWMGLLVSGPQLMLPVPVARAPGELGGEAVQAPPRPLGPWAQVVDLAQQDAAVAEGYAHVVQSMMLVDDAAQVRVRRSETAACRTVVAQDALGRILVLASEGAMTLDALARWLPVSGLQITRAMNLDGGVESQLAIVTPQLRLMLYGQYGSDNRLQRLPQATTTKALLPAVVAVFAGP